MKFIITLVVFLGISLGASAAGCVSQVPGLCQASKWSNPPVQVEVKKYVKKDAAKHQVKHKKIVKKSWWQRIKPSEHKIFKKGYKRFQKQVTVSKRPMKADANYSSIKVKEVNPRIGNEITGAPGYAAVAASSTLEQPGLFTRMYYQAKWAVIHIYAGIRWVWLLL